MSELDVDSLNAVGCDGIELLTGFNPIPREYLEHIVSVHLPYAADWMRGWANDEGLKGISPDDIRHISFGRDRDEVISNMVRMIDVASKVEPEYGVVHAGNVNLSTVMMRHQKENDRDVLTTLCEVMNSVSSEVGGEMPFKIAFENLWWPGLRMESSKGFEMLMDGLEFDNWGICLDTGHLLNTMPAYDEGESIDMLLDVFDGYPDEMKDRICTMHLNLSLSGRYRSEFVENERQEDEAIFDIIGRAYPHISNIDQHLPFSMMECLKLVQAISPEFVTHELMGGRSGSQIGDYIVQRGLFK